MRDFLFVRSLACSFVLATALAGSGILAAQTADPEILFLANLAPDRMQQELQKAADRGYRLVPLSKGWCVTRAALLEKPPAEVEPIEYLVLSTRRTGTMQQELNEASDKGYRFTGVLSSSSLTIAMQRSKGTATRTHEYLLLATDLASMLESELRREVEKGFRVVTAVALEGRLGASNDNYVMLLDRPVQAADAPRPDYLLQVTANSSTMQRELQEAADRGYRLLPLQGVTGGLLERVAGDVEPIDYLLVSVSRTGTMQKELDKASAEGYRFTGVLSGNQFAIAMQRAKGTRTRTHEQVLLTASRLSMMEREIRSQVAKGFRVVHGDCLEVLSLWRTGYEHVTILERRVP